MNHNPFPDTSIDLALALQAMDSANDGVTIVEITQPDQPLIYVNKAFERITGYSRKEVLGKNCRFLQGNIPCEPERIIIRDAIKNRTACRVTLRNVTKQGQPFWNELSLAPIAGKDGHQAQYFVGIQKDISTDISQKEKILHLSQHDDLTDLYNYRGFFVYSNELLERARDEKANFGVGILDIDNFKKINDILGHLYGNNVLKTLGHVLLATFKRSDVVSRLGGDEFVFSFLLQNGETEWFYKKIEDVVKSVNSVFSGSFQISVSAGICIEKASSATVLDQLIRKADQGMYQQKKQFYGRQ